MSKEFNTAVSADRKPDLPVRFQIKVKTNKVRTPGWRMFDFLVHFGINWVGNIGASLWFVHDQAQHNIKKYIKEGALQDDGKEYKSVLGSLYEWADKFKTKVSDKMWGVKYQDNPDEFGDRDPVKGSEWRADGSGITTDVLFLSFGGHITTALTQLFENSKVKPRMVRFLDRVLDRFHGRLLSREEQEERSDVYDKLDNELSGKSFAQTWKARFIGIATVIVALFGFRALDMGVTKLATGEASDRSVAGLNRVRQGFFKGAEFVKGGLKAVGNDWDPDFMKPAPTKEERQGGARQNASLYYANNMARMVATEVTGTTITSATQYLALMFKEFFGKQFRDKPEAEAETQTQIPAVPGVIISKKTMRDMEQNSKDLRNMPGKQSRDKREAEKETQTASPSASGTAIPEKAKPDLDRKVEAIRNTPEKMQEAERAAYAEKVTQARKPEKSDDYREAVSKGTQPQEAALAGA